MFVEAAFPHPSAGKERAERLMRGNVIRARHDRRDKVTTDSRHGLPFAQNLLAREFVPAEPNQVRSHHHPP